MITPGSQICPFASFLRVAALHCAKGPVVAELTRTRMRQKLGRFPAANGRLVVETGITGSHYIRFR